MRKGFTLIELLVVIAIIAILAAILFPVFARAREKARQTQCLSNTKQLNLAFQQYIQDYDERFPHYDFHDHSWYWEICIYTYVKNLGVYACPSRRDTPHIYDSTGRPHPEIVPRGITPRSYGYNSAYLSGQKLASVEDSAGTYLFHESYNQRAYAPNACSTDTASPTIAEEYADRLNLDNGANTGPHNDGANFAYVDGHSKWLSSSTAYGAPGAYTADAGD